MNLNRFCNSMILWRILIMNILIWICSKIVILIIIVCNKIIYSILSKMLCIKIRVMIACSKTIRTGRTNRIRSAFWIRTLFIILTRRLLTISKIILRRKDGKEEDREERKRWKISSKGITWVKILISILIMNWTPQNRKGKWEDLKK